MGLCAKTQSIVTKDKKNDNTILNLFIIICLSSDFLDLCLPGLESMHQTVLYFINNQRHTKLVAQEVFNVNHYTDWLTISRTVHWRAFHFHVKILSS